MRIRSNPHTHTTFSDGRSTPEAQVARALELGFVSLGFSDHSAQRVDAFAGMPEAQEGAYAACVRDLAARCAGRLRVWLGLELDSEFGLAGREDYDYILLSGHYAVGGGMRALLDCRPRRAQVFEVRDRAFAGDGEAMAADCFSRLGRRALQLRPQILGHFDLVKYFNAGGALYDPHSPRVHRAALAALEDIRASGALLEVNTGGMARGYVEETYPSRTLIRAWREMGGGVILGSDCHDAALMNYGFEQACAHLREDGFSGVWELGGEGEPMLVERRWEELDARLPQV